MDIKMKKLKVILIIFAIVLVISSVVFTLLQEYIFTPAEGSITQSLKTNDAIQSVKVNYTLSGIGGKVNITPIETETGINSTVGRLGIGIDINAKRRNVETATISFSFDAEKLDTEPENLAIAYYNESIGRMELLEDSLVDIENSIISVKTTHFSKYIVVNSKEWYDAWTESQMLIRDLSAEKRYFDVIFAIDSSGSMADDNKSNLSKECTYNFIENLYGGDYFSIYDFDDTAHLVIGKIMHDETLSWRNVKNKIMAIDTNGGTEINSAINAALANSDVENNDYVNIEILLTDGQSSVNDEVIKAAKDKGIKIITIGFGDNVNEELLTKIASATNGKYFKADTSNIGDIFNEIRQSYIGVNISTDTDNDGIPDLIETTGMRNQYGKIIKTNPNKADTDDDGISDGIEMGTVVVNDDVNETDKANNISEYIYFEMISDPTIYNENTEYNPKVSTEHSVSVSDDKSNIEFSFNIKNTAEMMSTNTNGNIINALKNAEATVTIPECCSIIKSLIYDLGNISSGQTYQIQETLIHDSTKCSGSKHIIGLLIQSDNLKDIYDEIRVDGIYWFETMNEEEMDDNKIALIEKIRRYTETYTIDDYYEDKNNRANLSNPNLTTEQKETIAADNKEDINKVIDYSNPRYSLNYLKNHSNFLAMNFRDYLESNTATKTLVKVSDITMGDGLLKNVTAESEIERYRKALLSFMEQNIDKIEADADAKYTKDIASDTISYINKILTEIDKSQNLTIEQKQKMLDELYKYQSNLYQINDCGQTANTIKQLTNYISELEDEYSEIKGITEKIGEYKVAFKMGGKILSFGSDIISTLTECITIETNLEIYQEQIDLLKVISNNTTNPSLRSAADQLCIEFENQYTVVFSEAVKFAEKYFYKSIDGLTDEAIAELVKNISDGANSLFASYNIGKFIATEIADNIMGLTETINRTVYLVGIAESSEIVVEYLDICTDEFNKAYIKDIDSAYETALKYKEFYNYAVELRKYGEDTYLSMVKIDNGIVSDYLNNDSNNSNEDELKNAINSVKRGAKNISDKLLQDADYVNDVRVWVNQTKEELDKIKIE